MDETVFERVIRKACERDWSQSDLAKRIGVSPQNITNWKARGVPSDQFVKIADALDCSLDELLGRWEHAGVITQKQGEWPFKLLDESKIRNMRQEDASRIEGAILLAAAQMGVDLKVSDDG